MTSYKKKLTCIICPKSCDLTITINGKEITQVEGNECEKGEAYAVEELISPKRVLTATVAAYGCRLPLLPVRSQTALPKELLIKCMKFLAGVSVDAPVKAGDVVVKNILGSGVGIIAGRSLDQQVQH